MLNVDVALKNTNDQYQVSFWSSLCVDYKLLYVPLCVGYKPFYGLLCVDYKLFSHSKKPVHGWRTRNAHDSSCEA
jgi:hypothetical protein